MTMDAAVNELASTIEEPPLGQLALFRSVFGVGVSLARFLEVHGDPGQRTRFSLLSEQWSIAEKIEASTNSTVALVELNVLDEQDQQEVDRLELDDFLRKQPQLPGSSTFSSLPLSSPSAAATPRMPSKNRKRPIQQEEGASSQRKCPVDEASELDGVPEVHDCKRKCPVGGSRAAEVPDYRRVVLVLRPPPSWKLLVRLSCLEILAMRLCIPLLRQRNREAIEFLLRDLRFVPPVVPERWSAVTIKTPPPSQRSREVLHPYPRAQATAALRAENKALRTEVAELRNLLEASRAETSTLTSLFRETSTSLDDRNKDLEASRRALQDVAADRLEYSPVLPQFRAIEAELPEAPLEDAITWFHLAVLEAHEELDAANACAMHVRDCLEELEESVHHYRARAQVAEELIRKYPEDEGLYEVDLPSLSFLQEKLMASEAMLRRMATLAHWLHSADPANLLHHHNVYVGGLIESIVTLLSRSLLHPPEQMRSVVELALEYLSQGRLTHGELHLRSISSLLYYYSNTADHVDGLYQDMFAHSCFSSDEVFLTAAQHAGYVNARPGSLEPPLHRRLFSFGHPIPLPQSPTSDHIPAVPVMDSVMLMWEGMIEAYICEVLGYPAPSDHVLPPVGAPSSNDPLPATASLVADDALPVPGVVVDLTMDDAEDLYESPEEFFARTGEAAAIKQEVTESGVV
ncbi:hypothetical protein GG344DRAFT_70870 [Lentinula edodes]|nr:hypothetical protein GG344DRAFT_70870 [Lentinula edodes]